TVVLREQVGVAVAWLVAGVLGVAVLPERVVQTVRAHVHEGEEVPLPSGREVAGHVEALLAHVEYLLGDPLWLRGAEVLHVELVTAGESGKLVGEANRVGEPRVGGGRHEARQDRKSTRLNSSHVSI